MQAVLDKTVGELVVERPSRAHIFESFGIDFCCGGKKKLGEACKEKQLESTLVVKILAASDSQERTGQETDWTKVSLTELCNHIEQTHHQYLKNQLPQLALWVNKVASRHGARDPRLAKLAEVFNAMYQELAHHMQKEELVLFPLCRQIDKGQVTSHCGTVQNPIRVMIAEHEDAGDALEAMSELTDAFTPPADACNTYRAMLDGLAHLRHDMHQHVHKENNILFPRAIELEHQLCQSAEA